MHVQRADGTIGVITGWKLVPGSTVMYNLEVAQDHTFTVGDGQWVVHNCARPKNEFFERYGSDDEMSSVKETGGLSFKPGHQGPDGGRKWVALLDDVDVGRLGSRKSYAWKMVFEVKPGTRAWLDQVARYKSNEPNYYGIPRALLGEFNRRIINITFFRR